MPSRRRFLTSFALGYAIGSIPVGVLVGRLSRGIDPREYGSHSMGMANVLRTAGRGPAAVTLALDIAKGAAAGRLGQGLCGTREGATAAGLGAIVGHSWPVYAGFRGGKSSATTFGAAVIVSPPCAGAALAGGLAGLAASRRTSVLSLVGGAAAAVTSLALAAGRRDLTPLALVGPGVAVVVVRHRDNIIRLVRGTEPEVSLGDPPPVVAAARRAAVS